MSLPARALPRYKEKPRLIRGYLQTHKFVALVGQAPSARSRGFRKCICGHHPEQGSKTAHRQLPLGNCLAQYHLGSALFLFLPSFLHQTQNWSASPLPLENSVYSTLYASTRYPISRRREDAIIVGLRLRRFSASDEYGTDGTKIS